MRCAELKSSLLFNGVCSVHFSREEKRGRLWLVKRMFTSIIKCAGPEIRDCEGQTDTITSKLKLTSWFSILKFHTYAVGLWTHMERICDLLLQYIYHNSIFCATVVWVLTSCLWSISELPLESITILGYVGSSCIINDVLHRLGSGVYIVLTSCTTHGHGTVYKLHCCLTPFASACQNAKLTAHAKVSLFSGSLQVHSFLHDSFNRIC